MGSVTVVIPIMQAITMQAAHISMRMEMASAIIAISVVLPLHKAATLIRIAELPLPIVLVTTVMEVDVTKISFQKKINFRKKLVNNIPAFYFSNIYKFLSFKIFPKSFLTKLECV